jgi:lysophospholipase L1-like esterase
MSTIGSRAHEPPVKLRSAVVSPPGGRFGLGTMASLGVLAGLSSALVALIGQARSTTRSIEAAALEAALADGTLVPPAVPGGTAAQQSHADHLVHVRLPQGDGIYSPGRELITEAEADATEWLAPAGPESSGTRPLVLAMLGDSTSVGYGVGTSDELPGVILARGLAMSTGRPVRMQSYGLTGARTSDLARQLAECLQDHPDVAVILIGANDLRDMVPPWRSAALLGDAVRTLTGHGIPVVAGTCPDFGVIIGIPQPLRGILGTWSTGLAALQDRAVSDAGGATVALGRLVGPQFAGKPEMFARDHFHPSGAGYGRAMAAMLPTLINELGRAALSTRPRADQPRSA